MKRLIIGGLLALAILATVAALVSHQGQGQASAAPATSQQAQGAQLSAQAFAQALAATGYKPASTRDGMTSAGTAVINGGTVSIACFASHAALMTWLAAHPTYQGFTATDGQVCEGYQG